MMNPNRGIHDSPTSVEVWLTLPDQSKLLHQEANQTLEPGGASADTPYVIALDERIRYQRMEGFGAAMTDSSAYLLMRVLDERRRIDVMNDLFTREGKGIGLSYVRVPIGASDFSLHDRTYNDRPHGETDPALDHFSIGYDEAYIIPALQMAQRLNSRLRFMGSPWSAPAWMKDNDHLHGGALRPEFYAAFANYLARFVQAYAEHGIQIDTLTPQNEPLHASDGYPTMLLSAQGQQALIRDFLGPALRDAGLPTRLLIFDHNWDLWRYPLEVLADARTAAFVDGIAFHCYGGDVGAQTRVHEAHPNKGIWFTECSGGGWAVDFADNLSWNLRTLVIGNMRHWGNSLILWNLALDENSGPQNGGCGDCRGVVTIDQRSGEVTYNVEYYVLGHVSRFVDPGAYRIESTALDRENPENVAFLNPDGSIVLVVHAARDVSFAVEWAGSRFNYSLPAGAAVTFKWGGASIPHEGENGRT